MLICEYSVFMASTKDFSNNLIHIVPNCMWHCAFIMAYQCFCCEGEGRTSPIKGFDSLSNVLENIKNPLVMPSPPPPPPHSENIDRCIINFTYFKLIIPAVLSTLHTWYASISHSCLFQFQYKTPYPHTPDCSRMSVLSYVC